MAAFDKLYERYSSRLFGFLRAQLKSQSDAEDIFHEAFIKTLKSSAVAFERRGNGAFRTWLYRVARNLALNKLRSEQRGARAHARLLEEHDERPQDADVKLEERELFHALDFAVARLPLPLSEVYHLRTSGLSYEEMATVLEIPLGTIKSRMNQMTTQLREDLRPWTAR